MKGLYWSVNSTTIPKRIPINTFGKRPNHDVVELWQFLRSGNHKPAVTNNCVNSTKSFLFSSLPKHKNDETSGFCVIGRFFYAWLLGDIDRLVKHFSM